jgi:hypothetical protein
MPKKIDYDKLAHDRFVLYPPRELADTLHYSTNTDGRKFRRITVHVTDGKPCHKSTCIVDAHTHRIINADKWANA